MLNHAHPELDGKNLIVFVDASRRYLDVSDTACHLLGYTRAEFLNKTIDDVSFHLERISKLFADYLKHGRQEGEFVLKHKSGKPIPIRYRAFVFSDGCNAAVWEPINDWRELYLAALVEIDPGELKRKSEVALHAVQQALREPKIQPAEQQSLRDASSALQSLLRAR